MATNFCARWRKICKQITCKAVRRALCGVALISSLQSMTHEEMSAYTHEELMKMSGAYMPKPGDYVVYGECDFTFTADADQKQISAELAQFREANPKYAAVVTSSCIAYGSLPDIVITAR